MSTSQCVPDPGLADTAPESAPQHTGASRLLKGLLIGFAVTVAIGLGLTSWYVGSRIVTANAAVNVVTVTPPKPPAPAIQQPPPVGLYLSVAGLGPLRDADFVKRLQSQSYRARVQRDIQGNRRILIGPFAGPSSLEEARRQLQSAGVLAIESAN